MWLDNTNADIMGYITLHDNRCGILHCEYIRKTFWFVYKCIQVYETHIE